MKKYFLHNGIDQQGPFDIEDLKSKNIDKETPIWYEGIPDWTTAEKIDELKDLFKTKTPPPFSALTIIPPPRPKMPESQAKIAQLPTKNKNKFGQGVFILVGVIVLVVCVLWIANMDSNSGSGSVVETYQEKVMTIEEIEHSQPTKFLIATGNYDQNFWGDKIKVHGIIKNTATIASFKDALVRVTYYSKTNTELGSKEYTIYEIFPPHSEVKFELKIENYKDVDAIGWDVIQATAN